MNQSISTRFKGTLTFAAAARQDGGKYEQIFHSGHPDKKADSQLRVNAEVIHLGGRDVVQIALHTQKHPTIAEHRNQNPQKKYEWYGAKVREEKPAVVLFPLGADGAFSGSGWVDDYKVAAEGSYRDGKLTLSIDEIRDFRSGVWMRMDGAADTVLKPVVAAADSFSKTDANQQAAKKYS